MARQLIRWVTDICLRDRVSPRAIVMRQKTRRPAQFVITDATREAVAAWIARGGLCSRDFLFRSRSRIRQSPHCRRASTPRTIGLWGWQIGLDPSGYSEGWDPLFGAWASSNPLGLNIYSIELLDGMLMTGRDDFKAAVKENLWRRVGSRCSNPGCRRLTVGPQAVEAGAANIGVAAHLTAAASGGPRYDSSLTSEQRASQDNGIWLCQTCSRLIDVDATGYPLGRLQKWKLQAEAIAFRECTTGRIVVPRALLPLAEDENGVPLVEFMAGGAAVDVATLLPRMLAAAQADLAGFGRTLGVPALTVGLTLTLEDIGGRRSLTPAEVARGSQLAAAVCVVAPPGAGKTVTLMQIAEAILAEGQDAALFIPMAEWAATAGGFFESVAARAGFAGFEVAAFRAVAASGRLVLILDAWNELDGSSRARAIAELTRLRRELPLLRVVASTRRQALDVPGLDAVVSLQGLSSQQQRELASIPLYLRALLSTRADQARTTTKEAVLRRMVEHHEQQHDHAQALRVELQDCHREFLVALATEANAAARTAVTEGDARGAVARAQQYLIAEGQIAAPFAPSAVLDSLVAHHVLVRMGGPERVLAFQHQQLQEWFASFEVERVMMAAARGVPEARRRLRTEILDRRPWEESILFACERAIVHADGRNAVTQVVADALAVDPMLASVIVSRVGDAVWNEISEFILDFFRRWHRPGEVDRAVRFMIITGRPEFATWIWPLISDADQQVHLATLRAAPRFDPRVLGADVERRLAGLPDPVREEVLGEIASYGGLAGMELAAHLAQDDPSTQVQKSVVQSLLFRGAERLAIDVLNRAPEAVWEELVGRGIHDFEDEAARTRLARLERQLIDREADPTRRLSRILHAAHPSPEDTRLLGELFVGDWPVSGDRAGKIVEEAFKRVPEAVLAALQRHVTTYVRVPAGAGDLLDRVAPIDYGPVAALVTDPDSDDRAASEVASLVGVRSVRSLLRGMIDLRVARGDDRWDRQSSDRFLRLRDRVQNSRRDVFIAAWLDEVGTGPDDSRAIEVLAAALTQHRGPDRDEGPLGVDALTMTRLVEAVRRMSERLLIAMGSTRSQMGDVAAAIGRLAQPALLPQLLALLAEDLRRWREARAAKARKEPGDHNDAHMDWTNWYARALAAIGSDAVVDALGPYLENAQFGEAAASALGSIDAQRRGVSERNDRLFAHKFARVAEARAARAAGGIDNSPLGAIVFGTVERLLVGAASEATQLHALALAAIAINMPYRDRAETTARLLGLPLPIRTKRKLAIALVRAGQTLDAAFVLDALRAYIEDAQASPWLLQVGQTWELDEWLALLPFTDRPEAVLEGFDLLPAPHQDWFQRRGMLEALRFAPRALAESVLAEFARRTPALLVEENWLNALLEPVTSSAVLTLLDLVREAPPPANVRNRDHWWVSRTVATTVGADVELRRELLRRYRDPVHARAHAFIEQILAAVPDRDTIVAMIDRYAELGRRFDGVLGRAVEELAHERREDPEWGPGAYEIAAILTAELRAHLIRKVGEGGASGTLAAECLQFLDQWHDRHGASPAEPRHPNVASGILWPVMRV